MDNLKKYLQEHKSELDIDSPSDGLWNNIQQQSTAKPTGGKLFKMALRYAVAACMLCVFAVGIKWLVNEKTKPIKPIAFEKVRRLENKEARRQEGEKPSIQEKKLASIQENKATRKEENKNARRQEGKKQLKISPEEHAANELVSNLETGYAQLVKMQLQKVRSTPVLAEGPNYFNEFKMQLKQMDIDEANIRHDIKKNGLNDALLDQLINVYQQKLNVLKNLQVEINKMNNQVKQNKSITDSTNTFYLNI